ncbi:MAG: copper amine oxidase [Firmicutes bacterium HGW-Firmicutes-7]|nr:MAG: copper amine oxidase [Firmicutes bacterium HGW-Firmicutes-7]
MKKLFGFIITFALLLSFTNISLADSYVMHTVASGDTYWKLSTAYQQDMNRLFAINQTKGESLNVGDFIKIKSLNKDIGIYVNNIKLNPDSSPYLENNRTFVPIRFISEALNVTIEWDGATSTAIMTAGDQTIKLPVGSSKAYVNGVSYNVDAPIKLYNGRVFIPIRFVSEVLGCNVEWNQQTYSVTIQTINNPNIVLNQKNTSYSEDDLYWLSRIVSAESSGEHYAGKLAVANVILNRKASREFPNTVYAVIFDKKFGYQFTPVANGTIYNTPTQDSLQAAKEALEGVNNIGNALFFVNLSKTNLSWIQTSRTYYKSIGNHAFYL